jgi:Protein of unknown function (DUF2846)
MKLALLLLLCAAPMMAQTPPSATAACGKMNYKFKVKLDDSKHALTAPDQGKARVYFFDDVGADITHTDITLGQPTVHVAMDGKPMGANRGNSYFSISVDPGEHHLCTTQQFLFVGEYIQLAHFTAEADKTYFFRTRLYTDGKTVMLDLMPIDSDQGQFLVESWPMSISTLVK